MKIIKFVAMISAAINMSFLAKLLENWIRILFSRKHTKNYD